MIGLLMLDVVFVFAELFLEAEYPSCRKIQKFVVSCSAAGGVEHDAHQLGLAGADDAHTLRMLSAHGSAHAASCGAGYVAVADAPVACTQIAGAHSVHSALDMGTLAILTIFMLELLTLLAALQTLFFRHAVNVLDLLVISASFTLQAYILITRWGAHSGEEHDVAALEDIQGLIIFARSWRFVRVGHGIASSMYDMLQTTNGAVHDQINELRHALTQLEHDLPAVIGAPAAASMQNVHTKISTMSNRFH